jgi:hypothetical protein
MPTNDCFYHMSVVFISAKWIEYECFKIFNT